MIINANPKTPPDIQGPIQCTQEYPPVKAKMKSPAGSMLYDFVSYEKIRGYEPTHIAPAIIGKSLASGYVP